MGVETQLIIVGEKLVIHMDGKNYEDLIESKRRLKVTKEEILSNLDIADKSW